MIRPFLLFAVLLLAAPLYAQPVSKQDSVAKSIAGLQKQFEQLAGAAQGRVGIAARLLETGESVAMNGDDRFPMQSVCKFPISMAVLHQVDQGKLPLDQKVRVGKAEYVLERQHSPMRDKYPDGTQISVEDLLQYAVSESDGSASDVLLRLVGGAPVVMAYLRSLGVTGVTVLNTEKEIGSDNAVQYRNWAQPGQAVTLLRAFQEGRGLSVASRALLLRMMTETQTGLHRLRGLLPAGTVVAHKTGSSWTVDGLTAATNNIGLITLPNGNHLAIAVFVADARSDEATREAVIARLAKAAWDYWK